jgi:hypothetical protein
MYSTCIYCGSRLGTNESIERFTVGRRLAFDAEKGRLWAICPACARWNLSPVEERWEAIEECERAFRATRLRTSTENIGLARLAEGVDLVRVGRPLRPEFAAWRYGGVMVGRNRRALFTSGAVAAGALAAVGLIAAMPALLIAGVPLSVAGAWAARRYPGGMPRAEISRVRAALRDNHSEPLIPRGYEAFYTRMVEGRRLDGGWGLRLAVGKPRPNDEAGYLDVREHLLVGSPAMRAVSVLLAAANSTGGSRHEVDEAVRQIVRAGSAEIYFTRAESEARKQGWGYQNLWGMPSTVRLALEMASHEQSERRALEGELADLETAWRDAEEVARIADGLAAPPAVEHRLDELRRRRVEWLSSRRKA